MPYHLVAADGLTMAAATRTQVAVFQPGYRWDALVVFRAEITAPRQRLDGGRQRQPEPAADAVARHRSCRHPPCQPTRPTYLKAQLLAAAA